MQYVNILTIYLILYLILQSAEVAKLQLVAKDEARRQEAAQKIAEQNKSFSEETEKKLQEKLKIGEENKTKQIRELQERLRDHVSLQFQFVEASTMNHLHSGHIQQQNLFLWPQVTLLTVE